MKRFIMIGGTMGVGKTTTSQLLKKKLNHSVMLSAKLEKALNAQINAEFWSAYLYLSMSTYCAAEGYAGFANWYNVQFKEEQDHALILTNYVLSRGGKVTLAAIDPVKTSWDSLLETMENTLEHEGKVTAMIHELYALAVEEKDFATSSALQWFIDEQVEEEETAQGWIDKLKMVGKDGAGLYMIDNEVATRTYTQAAPLTGKLLK